MKQSVFVTGGSGYIGNAVIPQLIERGHDMRALIRSESRSKIPSNCKFIIGNVLDNKTFKDKIFPSDTLLHLVGVSHPNPLKRELFLKVDFRSLEQTIESAISNNIKHFVYLSVAHPAPIMKSYVEVRKKCEELILSSKLNATIIRPWYVLGPGHRWPYLLIPIYKLLEKNPASKKSAQRLGLVTSSQMTNTVIMAIENPINGVRIVEVPEIKKNNAL